MVNPWCFVVGINTQKLKAEDMYGGEMYGTSSDPRQTAKLECMELDNKGVRGGLLAPNLVAAIIPGMFY
jgi:hypothetical protein